MNNYINFYYELYPDNIVKNKDNYTFVINNEKYYFSDVKSAIVNYK